MFRPLRDEEWLPAREQALAGERVQDRAAAESLAWSRSFVDTLEAEIAERG